MSIITQSSDLSLAPTLAPIVRASSNKVATALTNLANLGFHSVQLDATIDGIRPRQLSTRARKDLLALMNRHAITPAGIDAFVPRDHLTDPAQQDRAVSAIHQAITLAADLGRIPVSLALHPTETPSDILCSILQTADATSVPLALHAEDLLPDLTSLLTTQNLPFLGLALDPAAAIAYNHSPLDILNQHAKLIKIVRLSDAAHRQQGPTRLPISAPDSSLDLTTFRISADLLPHRLGPIVLDLRQLPNPLQAAAQAKSAWDDAAFSL